MDVTVRRIRNGEGQLYKQLRLTALQDSPAAFQTTYESALQRPSENWEEQSDATAHGADRATFLAFHLESPIGMIALYRKDQSDIGEVIQAWIAPQYRGKGVAMHLLNAMRAWAKRNRFKVLKFERRKRNGSTKSTSIWLK